MPMIEIAIVLGAAASVVTILGGAWRAYSHFFRNPSNDAPKLTLGSSQGESSALVGSGAESKVAAAIDVSEQSAIRLPLNLDLAVTPDTLDLGGIGPRTARVQVRVTDAEGASVPSTRVDLLSSEGTIRARGNQGATNWALSDDSGMVDVELDVSPSQASPGTAVVTALISPPGSALVTATSEVRIVGPPVANGLSLVASPETVTVGEPSAIVITGVDAIGQNVWNGWPVRLTSSSGTLSEPEPQLIMGTAESFLLTNSPGLISVVATIHNGFAPFSAICSVQAASPNAE